MKIPQVVGLLVVAVALTVAIEETRISRLKTELAAAAAAPAVASRPSPEPSAGVAERASEAPVRTKRDRPDANPAADPSEEAEDDSMARTVRKMWENPAGKAMMNQGAKFAVAMMYEDFIKTLNLSPEESEYLKGLLGAEISAQQELGMKMMGASPEDRMKLAEELKAKSAESDEAIRKFLNNDDDYQAFASYKARAPERQQLEALRAVMQSKGANLDAETEAKLVDAMYVARTNSGTPDYSGPNAFAELSKGDIQETFEENWRKQDELLMKEVSGFLDEDQTEAVREFRVQMKEMQKMGLEMVEKMMGGDKADE